MPALQQPLTATQVRQLTQSISALQNQQLLAQNQIAQQLQQAQMAAYYNRMYMNHPVMVTGGTPTSSTTTWVSTTTGTNPAVYVWDDAVAATRYIKDHLKVKLGESAEFELPDGSFIRVKADGSFSIDDKNSKVLYKANRVRDFNPFINVSDKLEDFIAFCGEQGVRKGEMLELPINLFIGWLVIQAAKADKEPPPDIKLLPDLRKRAFPRCRQCARFISGKFKAEGLEFCRPVCFERKLTKVQPRLICESISTP